MANITEPDVTTYVNQVVRPMADRMVGLKLALDAELATWNAHVGPLLVSLGAQAADPIHDGSELDGRTTITYNDLLLFVTQMTNLQTSWNGVGVFDVINKPRVNTIGL
jgi:hypothetical protein